LRRASPRPAVAQQECRLALLLGMDVSASVDAAEYQLQIEGLAAALIHPSVVEAALSGTGPVALSIYEWSGRFQQDVLVDWTLVQSEADLTGIAERVLRATRNHEDFPTALGYALGFASTHLNARRPACSAPSTSRATGRTTTASRPPRPMSTSPSKASR
jgi:hypothetical protein